MPWVRLDDRFPSHRKVALLSDRAFRLHVSALCWASENLTEGKILDSELRVIAHVRGMKTAAKELEERKLWDRIDDGWVIHDFLEYNPDRAKVQTERENNAARQAAFRERKRAEKEAKAAAEKDAREAKSNAVTPTVTYSVSNGTPCPPPSRSTSYGSTAGSGEPDRTGGVPDYLAPLRSALAAADLGAVAWDIKKFTDWERIRIQVDRLGVGVMVRSAVTAARTRGEPDSVTAWISRWETLPDPTPAASPSPGGPPAPDWCGKCESPDYRWLDNGTGYVRCRNCNPDAIGATP